MDAVVAVVVALIGAAGLTAAAYIPIRNLDRRNSAQHAVSLKHIAEIAADVKFTRALGERSVSIAERTETKVDSHLGWHQGRGDKV